MTGRARSSNVQIGDVVRAMAASEPCLFNNSPGNLMPVSRRESPGIPPSPGMASVRDRLMDAARWHAQLQVSFDRSLAREPLVLTAAHDQG